MLWFLAPHAFLTHSRLCPTLPHTCLHHHRHISFPVQTLGKCAKMLPVMIWGIFILRKTYGFRDFGLALLITAGCTVFLLTGEVKSKVGGSMWESR